MICGLLFLALTFTISSTTLHSAEPMATDHDIARAFRLAYEGELTDGKLVRALEARNRAKSELKEKLITAYLLSFSPRRLLRDPRSGYIDFVLAHKESGDIVGQDGLLRLYRIRGDEAFEEGKFAPAIDDYYHLLASENRLLRDYAVLKIGWGHLNLKHPEEAFTFWLAHVEAMLPGGVQAISPNLLSGLGLAFAEGTKRSEEGIDRLAKLPWEPTLRLAFVTGLEEGIEALTQEGQVVLLAKQSSRLPNYPELASELFEKTKMSGRRACRLLPFLSHINGNLNWSAQGRVVESCSIWASRETKDALAVSAKKDLESLFTRYALTGADRRIVFEYFRNGKREGIACLTALRWAGEVTLEKKGNTLPVKEIEATCQSGLATLTPAGAEEWGSMVKKVASETKALNVSNDPFLYLVTSTLKQPKIRIELTKVLSASVDVFRPTLLPAVIAEFSRKEKASDEARILFDKFGSENSGAVRTEAIWHLLLAEKVKQHWERKEIVQAFDLLEKQLPLSQASQLPLPETELWLNTIVQSDGVLDVTDKARTALKELFAAGILKKYSQLTGALLELGARYALWSSVFAAFENDSLSFSKVASERFKVEMFEAFFLQKADTPTGRLAQEPEIKFFVGLAAASRAREVRTIPTIKPVGKSPLVMDFNLVKSVQVAGENLLSANAIKRDRITQVLSWVQFMNGQTQRIEKHRWSNKTLFSLANLSLSSFCEQARGRFPLMIEVAKNKPDSVEQWAKFAPVLEKRLLECEGRKSL